MERQALEQLFERYASAWRAGTTAGLSACWDDAQFRFYKAEEIDQPFETWEDTLAYWQGNEAQFQAVAVGFSELRTMPLSEGWTSVMVHMRWDARFAASAPAGFAGTAMGGDNHVFALVYKDRFAAWIEAPDAPINYVRKLYEQQARDV